MPGEIANLIGERGRSHRGWNPVVQPRGGAISPLACRRFCIAGRCLTAARAHERYGDEDRTAGQSRPRRLIDLAPAGGLFEIGLFEPPDQTVRLDGRSNRRRRAGIGCDHQHVASRIDLVFHGEQPRCMNGLHATSDNPVVTNPAARGLTDRRGPFPLLREYIDRGPDEERSRQDKPQPVSFHGGLHKSRFGAERTPSTLQG